MTFIFGLGLSLVILFLIYGLYKSGQRIRRLEKETQDLRRVISSGYFGATKDFKAGRQWALSFHREERRFTVYPSDSQVEQEKQKESLSRLPKEEKKTFCLPALKTIGAGLCLSGRHKIYGEILSGAGLGIFYFLFFLATVTYGLISGAYVLPAFFLIAILGGYFSFISNSKILGVLTVFGGIPTLLLLSVFGIIGASTLFNGLIILNAGILSLSFVKGWYDVSFGAFIATVLSYLVFLASMPESALLNLSFFYYVSASFLLFFSFSLLCGLGRSEKGGLILALFVLNPFFFLFIGLQEQVLAGSDWLGFLFLFLSALYLVVYLSLPKKPEHEAVLRNFSLGISAAFFVFFVPVHLESFYIPIGWAFQATFLFILACLVKSKSIDFLARLIFVLVFFRLVIVDTFFFDPSSLIFNLRFGLFLSVMLFLVFSYLVSLRLNKNQSLAGKNFLLFQIYFLGLWSFSLEVLNFLPNFFLPFVWLLSALLLGVASLYLHNFWLRMTSYATFVFSGVWILLTQSFLNPPVANLILNSRAFSFLSLMILGAVFLFFLSKSLKKKLQKEYRLVRQIFFSASALLIFWLVTRETMDGFVYRSADEKKLESWTTADFSIDGGLILSSVWMFYAFILLFVGLFKKLKCLSFFAVAIFVLIIGKTFFFDAAHVDYVYRLVSFLVLGGILFVTGYVYIFFSRRLSKMMSDRKNSFLNLNHR